MQARREAGALSDLLASAGVLLAAGASAASILLPAGRLRSAAMLLAIVLFPILILGDQWHTAQIVDLRHDTGRIVALLVIATIAIGVLACLFSRWPVLMPLAIIAALPFRVPLHAGGDTANLLVPLYLVIAGGVVAVAARDWPFGPAGPVAAGDPPPPAVAKASSGAGPPTAPPAGGAAGVWLPRVLATVVVLYGVQTLYSGDFSKGLQNVCFFLVPFTVAYGLLSDIEWDKRLLRWALYVVAAEAVAFVLIGSVEYVTRSLFWNDQVIRSNEFHTYFRVNSVFWDPNVYGRYLALVIVAATAALLWVKERREFALLTALVGVLWIGLAQTFSQSSFIALLAGLAVLAALRWSWRWTLGVVAVGSVVAVLVVLFAGGSGKIRLNVDTSGRANLVSGGGDLFTERPIWGYGSGSFQRAYRDQAANKDVPVSVSHTEPVTVAAEQGVIGLILYGTLIVLALWTMSSGLFASRAGGIGEGGVEDALARRAPPSPMTGPARQAILAAFVALLVHTMAYAGFFEDPITWVLLAIGASLAAGAAPMVRQPA
jgi:O-antigen ligase/polysaccharide polymerase Wzy-like membrane protein